MAPQITVRSWARKRVVPGPSATMLVVAANHVRVAARAPRRPQRSPARNTGMMTSGRALGPTETAQPAQAAPTRVGTMGCSIRRGRSSTWTSMSRKAVTRSMATMSRAHGSTR